MGAHGRHWHLQRCRGQRVETGGTDGAGVLCVWVGMFQESVDIAVRWVLLHDEERARRAIGGGGEAAVLAGHGPGPATGVHVGDDHSGEGGDSTGPTGHRHEPVGVGRAQRDAGGVRRLGAGQGIGHCVQDEVVVFDVGKAQVHRDPRGVVGTGRLVHDDAVDVRREHGLEGAVPPVGPEVEALVLRRRVGEGGDIGAPGQVDAVAAWPLNLTREEVAGYQIEVLSGIVIKRPLQVNAPLSQPRLYGRFDVEAQPGGTRHLDAVESVGIGGVLIPLVLAADPHPDVGDGEAVRVADGAGEGEGGCIAPRVLRIGWRSERRRAGVAK